MNVQFQIHYFTKPGQVVMLSGSSPEIGCLNEDAALEMNPTHDGFWELTVPIEQGDWLEYRYFIRKDGRADRLEWGTNHRVFLPENVNLVFLRDSWQAEPDQTFLYTSAYTDILLAVKQEEAAVHYGPNRVILKVRAPFVRKNQCLGISGDSAVFGGWKNDKALRMHSERFSEWAVDLDANKLPVSTNYKFVLLDKTDGKILHYEWGEPRVLITPQGIDKQMIMHSGMSFRFQEAPWKGAGVVLPVFSLKSENSWGCGDFGDLKKMIDWADATGLQLIQTLPLNDTTLTESGLDSYPYSAISNFALHPMYCSIHDLPALKDGSLMKELENARLLLNALPQMDYEKVLKLKGNYLKALFNQEGLPVLDSSEFKRFLTDNQDWLVPYAAFSYLRRKTGESDFRNWGDWVEFNAAKIQELTMPSQSWYPEIALHYYIQYLLHGQLTAARDYAHEHSVVLKGDIPIGVSRDSVEAWSEGRLFNMEAQMGAPPDDFSDKGQNWDFPSYHWEHLASEGFRWWKRRLEKMADYFDAYRIDHILGFFRIWEIPRHSVEGLLGHFSPALPLHPDEMHAFGFRFNAESMTTPFLPENLIRMLFGAASDKVAKKYLKKNKDGFYQLKPGFETQQHIMTDFGEEPLQPEKIRLRNNLYALCNEVLFLEDPYQKGLYHPRISAFGTEHFRWLNDEQKYAFTRLYNDFYFVRNTEFWRQKAMDKLPALIQSTRMLACGEDLGMIPSCVPEVMRQLNILSLEIERMPKTVNVLFENLNNIPYESVCTTSTHDMNPIRAWWLENPGLTQQYYNQVLWKSGEAPAVCDAELATNIVQNHLSSPALWVILPWQDWMATDKKLCNPDPLSERINIPSNPHHYWCYRMHLTLEQLLRAFAFNAKMKGMVSQAGRA